MKTKKNLLFWVPVIIWMGLIFAFSGQSGIESQQISGSLTEWLLKKIMPQASQQLLEMYEGIIRTLAHFCVFAVLGGLSLLAAHFTFDGEIKLSSGVSSGYALLDELHQMFVPGRTFQIGDILVDCLGAALGILIMRLILHLAKRIKANKAN